MFPLNVTLPDAYRSDLMILVEVIFWIFVPVSFICVARYVEKQVRAGQLFNRENAPTPLPMSGPGGWLFIVAVLELIYVQSALYVLIVVAGVAGQRLESGKSVEELFGLRRIKPVRVVSWSLLVFGAVMLIEAPVSEAVMWLFKTVHLPSQEQETVESFRHLDGIGKIASFIFMAAFVFPIFEELFFRGLLLTFLKKYTSTWMALLLSSGVFAFAHLNLAAALPLWLLGLVLGIAYEHTGCLLLPIGIHACWNLVTALSILLDKGNS